MARMMTVYLHSRPPKSLSARRDSAGYGGMGSREGKKRRKVFSELFKDAVCSVIELAVVPKWTVLSRLQIPPQWAVQSRNK